MNEEWCVGYQEGNDDAMKEIEAAIEDAVNRAVLAEREACAKVCDELYDKAAAKYFDATADECAEAIRARTK